jgi:hypothetical protein
MFLVFEVFPNFTEYTLPFSKADLVVKKKIFNKKATVFERSLFCEKRKKLTGSTKRQGLNCPLLVLNTQVFIRCVR